jgi:proteasome lid subunit RPN8/RPN11
MKNSESFRKRRNSKLRKEMEQHALSEPEREVCGFVYKNFYLPLRNLASDHRSFYADPADIAIALARYGEPEAIFHTHPTGFEAPSETDWKLSYYSSSTIIIGILERKRLYVKEYGSR